ncbi:VCBS repeat-containing protein [bacterium]|nr:VCBS repeat-containing protein [bacterium]
MKKRTLLLFLLIGIFCITIYSENWERTYLSEVNNELWLSAFSGGRTFSSPFMTDINNDGRVELFVGGSDGKIHYFEDSATQGDQILCIVSEEYGSIDIGDRSVPFFCDIDGDNDMDLFIGKHDGTISFYRNDGTTTAPSWTEISSTYNGIDVGFLSCPSFIDIDGDNDLDMFIGESSGNINFYRNDGSSSSPAWSYVTNNYNSIDVGSYSFPCFYDIDCDDDYDLFIGKLDGQISFYENTGSSNSPNWLLISSNYSSIDVGYFSYLSVYDVDQDQKAELYIGCTQGNISQYINTGTVANPSWSLVTNNYAKTIDYISSSNPSLCDIDADGDYDMFIGANMGHINYFRNDGNISAPAWTFITSNYNSINVGNFAAPVFIDIDNDGDQDMFCGNLLGNIYFYRNDGNISAPAWTFITSNYNSIDVGLCAVPAFCDIDNDGDFDMFVGEDSGQISYYNNDGTSSVPSWTLVTTSYNLITLSGNSAPAFCDKDNDGDFDMFVGEENGQFSYYVNNGTSFVPSWTLVTTSYNSIDIGSHATPVFCDIDADGDFDMFVGEHSGGINWWNDVGDFSISGTINDGVLPIENVSVYLEKNGNSYKYTFTDTSGNYEFSNLDQGSNYTVVPSHPEYLFTPLEYNYLDLPTNIIDADFTGTFNTWKISGVITDGTDPVPDVNVELSGGSTSSLKTSSTGYYEFTDLNAGATYIITPHREPWIFTPTSRIYADLGNDVLDATFTGTLNVKKWTIGVYLCADNNLEYAALDDFMEMSKIGSDENMNIVVQFDRVPGYSSDYGNWETCKRFYVNKNMTPEGENAISDIGEADMGDGQTLEDFGKWVYDDFPADHYCMIIWDHGDGWRSRDINSYFDKGACSDDTNGSYLYFTTGEIPTALSNVISYSGGAKWDIIGFDVCLDQMWENNNACAPYFNYFVASEMSEWGEGWSYWYFLQKLQSYNGNLTGQQLANYIVEAYANGDGNYCGGTNNVSTPSCTGDTLSSIDLNKISDLNNAINSFSVHLMNANENGYSTEIDNARNSCFELDDFYYDDQIDLYDFCEQIEARSLPAGLKDASSLVRTEILNVTTSNFSDSGNRCYGIGIYHTGTASSYDTNYNNTSIAIPSLWDDYLKGSSSPINLKIYEVEYLESQGNDNGIIEVGEIIDLTFSIENSGADAAESVSATLSCTSPNIIILSAISSYPNIAASETKISNSPYKIEVKNTLNESETIYFDLMIDSNGIIFSDSFSLNIEPKIQDLSQVNVYPNPCYNNEVIVFENIPEHTNIKIYDISGVEVYEHLTDSERAYEWNMKNNDGEKISAGVYIYIIENDKGERKICKFAIIK